MIILHLRVIYVDVTLCILIVRNIFSYKRKERQSLKESVCCVCSPGRINKYIFNMWVNSSS